MSDVEPVDPLVCEACGYVAKNRAGFNIHLGKCAVKRNRDAVAAIPLKAPATLGPIKEDLAKKAYNGYAKISGSSSPVKENLVKRAYDEVRTMPHPVPGGSEVSNDIYGPDGNLHVLTGIPAPFIDAATRVNDERDILPSTNKLMPDISKTPDPAIKQQPILPNISTNLEICDRLVQVIQKSTIKAITIKHDGKEWRMEAISIEKDGKEWHMDTRWKEP